MQGILWNALRDIYAMITPSTMPYKHFRTNIRWYHPSVSSDASPLLSLWSCLLDTPQKECDLPFLWLLFANGEGTLRWSTFRCPWWCEFLRYSSGVRATRPEFMAQTTEQFLRGLWSCDNYPSSLKSCLAGSCHFRDDMPDHKFERSGVGYGGRILEGKATAIGGDYELEFPLLGHDLWCSLLAHFSELKRQHFFFFFFGGGGEWGGGLPAIFLASLCRQSKCSKLRGILIWYVCANRFFPAVPAVLKAIGLVFAKEKGDIKTMGATNCCAPSLSWPN